jgi:hypothetical protein
MTVEEDEIEAREQTHSSFLQGQHEVLVLRRLQLRVPHHLRKKREYGRVRTH